MDLYIGLDVSLASTAICVVSAQGKLIKETAAASEPDKLLAGDCPVLDGVRLTA
jgi:transposase